MKAFTSLKSLLGRFRRDTSGASAIEYGLIVAGIALAIGVAATTLGGKINTMFGNIGTKLDASVPATTTPTTPPAGG